MEEKKKKIKQYQRATGEFREEAVRLVRSGSSVEKVAANLNVNPHTLGSWVRKSKALERKSSMKNEQGKTMLELEAELKRVQKENDCKSSSYPVLRKF